MKAKMILQTMKFGCRSDQDKAPELGRQPSWVNLHHYFATGQHWAYSLISFTVVSSFESEDPSNTYLIGLLYYMSIHIHNTHFRKVSDT